MTDDFATAGRVIAFREALFVYRNTVIAHRDNPTRENMDATNRAGLALVDLYQKALTGTPLGQVLREVEAERCAQVARGYDAVHDDGHASGEIGVAAALYAMPPGASLTVKDADGPMLDKAFEIRGNSAANWMRDRRRRLVIAAALAIAEVERLDRAEAGRAG